MSVHFLTGVPGAGKTYFAVNEISKELAKKSRPIYTNINLKIPYDDYIQPLDISDFYDFLSKELAFFEKYKADQSLKRKDDPEHEEADNYDEALKTSGILDKYGNAFIVWDECHNDLDRLDPVYIRWLSYHRHYEGMDVLLITQALDLIERKYRRFADKFYFGQNAAKRLFSTTFKYKVYTDHREYEKYLIETISLPSKREIFALYDSGFYKVNKSAALKKLGVPFLIVVFLAIFIKYVFFGFLLHRNADAQTKALEDNSSVITVDDPTRSLNPDDNRSVDQMKKDALTDNQVPMDQPTYDNLQPPPPLGSQSSYYPQNQSMNNQASLSRYLIRFQCTQRYCYFNDNKFSIPLNIVERFFKEFNGKILSADPLTHEITVMTAIVPHDLYMMIQSHNIVTRSDNYVPQNQYQSSYNSFGGTSYTAPQFQPVKGF